MRSKVDTTRLRFFSAANRPTHNSTKQSWLAPHSALSAGERRTGLNKSVSTPRGTTCKRSKPTADNSLASPGVGTMVAKAALWNLRM